MPLMPPKNALTVILCFSDRRNREETCGYLERSSVCNCCCKRFMFAAYIGGPVVIDKFPSPIERKDATVTLRTRPPRGSPHVSLFG
jgi:hypothetical protein